MKSMIAIVMNNFPLNHNNINSAHKMWLLTTPAYCSHLSTTATSQIYNSHCLQQPAIYTVTWLQRHDYNYIGVYLTSHLSTTATWLQRHVYNSHLFTTAMCLTNHLSALQL
jgi:hypothetical protein